MSIQTRLKKQRYSPATIYQPVEDELLAAGIQKLTYRNSGKNKPKLRIIMEHPPKKDQYYQYLKPLIDDFYTEVDLAAKNTGQTRTESHLIYHIIVRKIAYYIYRPNYYGNSWRNFGISMMFGILMHMRQYVMRQKIMRGEMKPVYDKYRAASHGYYPLPKPMGNDAMAEMADQIYDIFYSDAIKELVRNGLLRES